MSSRPPSFDRPADERGQVSRRDFLRRSTLLGLAGAGAGTFLAACGSSDGESASGGSGSSSQSSSGAATGEVDKTVTLHPKGNQMKYRETEFTVAPGETIELVFDNTATSPSMQHNVVVLNTGPEEDVFKRVGEAGMQAGASNDYVSDDPAILAHTPIAKPGETVSTTFTAPDEAGDYGYVCTFPGHWATMQGTMHVEEGAAA